MKVVLPLLAALSLALSACSTTSSTDAAAQSAAKPMEDREYRTGSRIPVRDPAAQSSSPTKSLDPSVMAPGTPKVN